MDGETSANAISGITTALKGSAETIANTGISSIGDVLPVIAPIFAAVVVIGIVYKVIKKFSNG